MSRAGPFDVHQDHPHSGASPRLLDGMQGCQFRMTSYDEEHSGPDFTPVYGVQPALVCGCTGIGTSTQPQPRVLGTSLGKREDTLGRATAAARRWADTIECTGSPAACNGAESNIVRRDAVVMGTCGTTCGVRDNRRHHVFRLGSLIGLRSMARFGWA